MLNLNKFLVKRAQGKKPSPIRELQKFLKLPDMISLGGGYPNPATFAFEEIRIRFRAGFEVTLDGAGLLGATQYGPSDVLGSLKGLVVEWHKFKDRVELSENELAVLNGSQEGLFIMGYLFLDPEDSVVVSEPTYPGAISAFESFSRNFVQIPLDKNGMNTKALEKTLQKIVEDGRRLPKFIYEIPNGHNPGGVSMNLERRWHLIELACRYDLLILEDDPYELLLLDDVKTKPTLQSLDPDGRVIRLDSFSKIFAPGLRLGYASGNQEIIRQFVLFKQSSNLHTSTFAQTILQKFLQQVSCENFRKIIRDNCRLYKNNRDKMIESSKKYLPEEVKYNIPGEGMFIWFELPEGCDAKRMLDSDSLELKVLLVPGQAFSTAGGLKNCMRASFSLVTEKEIDEGIRRFGEMIKREYSRN